jgi:polysaccharide pyruvyl transferase CsaB
LPRDSVVIAGYYGFGNAGDELILYALIQRLRLENPRTSITVLSNNPSETRERFQVAAVDRWRPWTWASPLFHASSFLLGGGGLLQESTGPWNHVYYLSLLLAAKLFGCQTDVVAIGVDPLRSRLNQFLTRFVLNLAADELSVRDEASRQVLQKAGVRVPIAIQRDPVFDLATGRHSHVSGRIAFAVSPSKRHPSWYRSLAELCDLLSKRLDVAVDFLVFFPKEDEAFAREVIAHAAFEPHVRCWENPLELLDWMTQYDLVVATRFHALVLCAASGTPFVGWGEQSKVSALCEKDGRPYHNTEEHWDIFEQLQRIVSAYPAPKKSITLLPL